MSRSHLSILPKCKICFKDISSCALKCSICFSYFHKKCCKQFCNEKDISNWLCFDCEKLFPFHDIDDDDFTVTNSSLDLDLNLAHIYKESLDYDFKPFEYTEFSSSDFQQEIDPDNNFFNDIKLNCKYYTESQLKHSISNKNGLSIIHFNCRSLNANFTKIEDCLNEIGKTFDIIAISESWLNNNSIIPNLQGYECCHQPRISKKGGGVALFINNHLDFKILNKMTTAIDDVLECISVELIFEKSKNVVVSCVYRQPGTPIDICIDTLNAFFSPICKKKNIYICGDFNINLLNSETHKGTRDFLDFLYSLGVYPLINKPSRIALGSSTLIDNIFTNNLQNNHFSGLLINDISDHLPIFTVQLSCLERKLYTKYITVRNTDDEAINAFRLALDKENWANIFNTDDVNICYDNFLNKFLQLFNEFCPVKQIKTSQNKVYKPWFTNGLKNACRKKNQLYAKYLSSNCNQALEKYKKYKNKLTKILRSCEKHYFDKILKEQSNNIRGTWKILNSIIGKNKVSKKYPEKFKQNNSIITNKKDISNGFNSFFVNIGPDLAKSIIPQENSDITDYLKESTSNSMFIKPTNEKEILEIVSQADAKHSTDSDGLSMHILKKVFSSVCKPFTEICNKSLLNGVFPESMKVAKVIPLYKSGDNDVFTNYRPVSLLPQFSKILEKLFDLKLDNFIEKHNILADEQYGFRKSRSTSMAITHLIENLTDANEEKKFTAGVFIDLKKAFDTIDHSLLLKKLDHYGIRGVPNDWLKSYLSNRKQFVSFDDFNSNLMNISCGVPQGSILGPSLFILYINDICNVSKILKFVLFADDTNIFCSDTNILNLSKTVSKELDKLNIWFAVNKLSLNISKTNFIIFGNRKFNEKLSITINEFEIERVYVTKFLGVFIDHKLNWKYHIENICTKISRNISIIYKASKVLGSHSLRSLYCTLILPYLNYCAENWGNTYQSNLNKIFLKQKKVIRIICKASYYDHTNLLFKGLNLLKLEDLIKLKNAIFMFKVFNRKLPPNLLSLFHEHTANKRYNLRTQQDFQPKTVRTKQKQMCISCQGIDIWNSIDRNIKSCNVLESFKFKYKKYLLSMY